MNPPLQKVNSRIWYQQLLYDKRELELRKDLDHKLFDSDPKILKLKSFNYTMQKYYLSDLINLTILAKFKIKLFKIFNKHHRNEANAEKLRQETYFQENLQRLKWEFITNSFKFESIRKSNKILLLFTNIISMKQKY